MVKKGNFMENYVISCCSTSDLNKEYYTKRNINYICFHFYLGYKEYVDNFGESISYKEFYKQMGEGVVTKTSQVNTEEFIEYFDKFLQDGKDIIHVSLSSGLSGVINSANIARDILKEKYPERNIIIIDSLGASSGYGLLMDTLANYRDEGKSINEAASLIEGLKLNLHHWFFSTDLTYYVRGGRISKSSGFIGNVLHICPLLNMDNNGRLIPREKILGKKRVIQAIFNKMVENAVDGINYSGKCFISNSDCYEDAKTLASLIESKFLSLKGKVEIFDVGTTIVSHTGPGTVALFFFGKVRSN